MTELVTDMTEEAMLDRMDADQDAPFVNCTMAREIPKILKVKVAVKMRKISSMLVSGLQINR